MCAMWSQINNDFLCLFCRLQKELMELMVSRVSNWTAFLFVCWLFPTGSLTHMGNLKTADVRACVRACVRASVRACVRSTSDLGDYPMDLLDIWYHVRPISGNDARFFGVLKKSKMADLYHFCKKLTFQFISHHLSVIFLRISIIVHSKHKQSFDPVT